MTANAVSTSQINLSWNASTDNVGIAGYRIYRNGTLITTLGNVTTYQNTGLTASATYSYTVQALDMAGNPSAQSAPASATTLSTPDTTPPSTPTGLTATAVSSSQINLNWTASTDNVDVTGYRVYRDGALVATLGNVTTYQNTGLSASTTYSYTVQALDGAGNASGQSSPATATTQAADTTPPSTPTGLTATAVSSLQINLSWTASTDNVGVTGYRVFRDGALLVTLGNVTTYQDTGLKASTTYSYTVQALDAAGNESPQSAQASATTPASIPGSINVSLVAARTSGVAPLAVFFDATGTTDSGTTRPFHDLEYQWNFGDPGSGNWRPTDGSTTGRSRNTATGPVAAHVFETPGTYTVNLSVFNGTNTATTSVQITVGNPDDVFSGSNTRCFSTSGIFTGCPTGAQQITTNDFDAAIAAHKGTGRRLLFRREETFFASSTAVIDANGPGAVGAFGSGASPIIRATASSIFLIRMSGGATPDIADWRIMDLELDGNSRSETMGVRGEGGIDQLTLLRLNIHDTGKQAIHFAWNILDDWNGNGMRGHTIWDQFAIVDTSIRNLGGGSQGIMAAAERFAVLGNTIDAIAGHCVRHQYIGKGVISHNTMGRPTAADLVVVKIHAPIFGSTGVAGSGIGQGYTRWVVLSDNSFVGNTGVDWSVVLGPQNAQSDERLKDFIVERNWFKPHADQVVALQMEGIETSTTRNNIFDLSGAGRIAVNVTSGVGTAAANAVVYNNTFYSSASSNSFTAANFTSGSGHVARNNLAYAPNHTSSVMFGSTTGLTHSHNSSNSQVKSTSPSFVSATPSIPADFKLNSASYAIDSGTSVPVFSDFFRLSRPQNGVFDLGAMERP